MRKNTGLDMILIGFTMMIGLAEAAHLAAAVLGWSFSRCAWIFVIGFAVVVCGLAGLYGYLRDGRRKSSGANKALWICFGLVVLSQVIFLLFGDGINRDGDMVAEAVNSFVSEDAVYTVNPMTGRPYTAGIPLRLKILCLPSLYGFWKVVTGVSTFALVERVVPVVILLLAYVSFGALGKVLFPENGRRRAGFLLAVALLMWVSAYAPGMDGYGLLCQGWTGTSIRNTVLMPWLFSLMLRRKYPVGVLCILAEACITWTLYGAGVGVLVFAGMFPAGAVLNRMEEKKNGGRTGKEAE